MNPYQYDVKALAFKRRQSKTMNSVADSDPDSINTKIAATGF